MPVTHVNCIVLTVNLKANDQVLCALQEVVGQALKSWLNENKAEVLQAICAAVVKSQTLPRARVPEE